MNRIKHFMILALALTLSLGAWAQTHQRYTGPVAFSDLQVGDTLAPGFSITDFMTLQTLEFEGNRHKQNGNLWNLPSGLSGNDFTGYGVDNPVAIIAYDGDITYTPVDESGQDGNAWVVILTDNDFVRIGGISLAPDPTVPALDETTGHWNFLMPGSNKVVKAVLYDSVLIGANVAVQCSTGCSNIAYGYRNAGGDTILYFENSPILILTANAPEGKAFDGWNDGDPWSTRKVKLEGDTAFLPIFYTPHTLTLNQTDGGSLTLDGVVEPGATGTTFSVPEDWKNNNNPFTVYNFPGFEAVSLEEARNWQPPVSGNYRLYYNIEGNILYYVSYSSDGPQATGTTTNYRMNIYNVQDDGTTVAYTTGAIPGGMPAGVLARNANGSYQVKSGTELTLVATPDTAHYLTKIGNYDTLDNHTVEYTFTMPDEDTTVAPTFNDKPTLTLAANDGGTLEAFDAANVTRIGTTNQYYIDYGTPVTVVATPDATHYLATLGEELVNSNDSIHRTYTMTAPVNLPADFRAKPVLTLAQNENWGSVTIEGAGSAGGAGGEVTIGDSTSTTTNPYIPGNSLYEYAYSQQIYTADEIGLSGDITSLTMWLKNNSSFPRDLEVYMKEVDRSAFASSSDWEPLTSDNLVATGTMNNAFNAPVNYTFNLTTPFHYSGTGNLLLCIRDVTGDWNGGLGGVTMEAVGNQAIYAARDGNAYDISNPGVNGTLLQKKNVVKFHIGAAGSGLPAGVAQLTDNTYRVDYGTTLTVNAQATELHHVANWVDADSVAYPADSITYSAYFITEPEPLFPAHSTLRLTVTADATAKAVFGINSYDVTASVAPTTDVRGTVRIASTDVQGAAQVSDSLATVTATAQGGSTSTLTAYPAWGYHFVEWQNQNGTQVSTDNPLAVTSAVDTALVAVFDTTKAELAWSDESFTGYTLIDFNNWAPTLTNSHNVEVRYGCVEGTLNVDAQSGIVGVEVAYGFIPTTVGTYHIYAVHDLSQEYFYDSVVYTLTVERGTIVSLSQNIETGGTAVFADQDSQPTLTHYYASGIMAFVAHGHTVDLVAEPAEGYHFTAWQEGDLVSGYTDIATSLEHTYTVPDATTAGLKAVFDTNVYNVTIVNDHDTLTDLAMGVDTVYRMKHFLDQPLTAEAKFGYYFVQWADSVTDNPRMVNVTGDTAFRAQYDRRTFYVTVVVDTARAHGSGTRICRYLDYFPITITPKHGYHFVQWSDGNTQNPRYVTCTGNATYSAQMAPDQFTVSGSANQNLGTISGLGNHDYMSTATLTATPNHGYRFDHWNDGVTANPRSVVVTKDTAFEAFFVIGQYTVTAASANATMGSAAGTATVNYLDTVQISATANAHYHFVKWNDNNTQNPRKVVATNNVTYTAQFAADNYTVTGLADQGMGSVTGSGSYAYLSNATLTAVPACGYLFDHWSNDSTATTITVKVTGPTTLTAYFRPAVVDTVTVTVHDTTVVTNTVIVHDTTYVDIHDSVDVTVYVHDTTTVEVPVYVHDTTMVEVLVHDTTTVEVPVYVHDTTMVEVPVYVHDTTYIDIHDSVDVTVYVYVHDTTTVEVPVYMHDTTTVEVPVYVHDTTTVEVPVYVHDTTTVEVPVYVHDTTTVEVPVYVYDTTTIEVPVHDTTTIEVPVHDTTTVTEYIVDTLWLTEYIHDTVWQIKYIYDTVYIHDTIFVGIDDVEALDAKIYANNGQIVVEGADGNTVVLYDVTGRILAKKQDEFAPLRFDIPASGTYLVKIGNHAARRIVMIR